MKGTEASKDLPRLVSELHTEARLAGHVRSKAQSTGARRQLFTIVFLALSPVLAVPTRNNVNLALGWTKRNGDVV
jgi:hypothetical protein